MARLLRGLFLLLALFTGFVVFDISGRDVNRADQIAALGENETQATAPLAASEAAAVQASPAAAAALPIEPRPAGSQVVETPAPVPVLRRTSSRNVQTLSKPDQAFGDTFFDNLMTPFFNQAEKRRAEQAKSDPEYSKRIDPQLNQGRVNFLLFGYGETHEPPATERAIIGSHTVISYNTRTHEIDIISLTHDIRSPEIERELSRRSGQKSLAVRIDQAYNVGGFSLMRQVLEDATGLSIDFQIAFKDSVMQSLIDGVFGGVDVNVPAAFDVHPFYLDGKKYDRGHFTQGLQRLNGRQVIQFIKTVPVTERAYDKSLEHNVRKALVFDALLAAVGKTYQDRTFWLKASGFVAREMLGGSITYDFDPVSLMINNIGATAASIGRTVSRDKGNPASLPKISQSKYVVDPAQGDGGVQWVGANAAVNPLTKKDVEDGVYPSMDMEIPINANPYGDLPTEYWTSVRTLVETTLENANQ